jgi:AraC-like DNA-binding protein
MLNKIVHDLLNKLSEPFTGEKLFDQMTDLVYFIKNQRGQYVIVNQSLANRCGFADKRELIGRTVDQVFRPPLGTSYRAQDEAILKTGTAILNQLELHAYPSRETGWCLTNKIPLFDKKEQIVGLVGISKDLHMPSEKGENYSELSRVIQYIHTHYDQPLKVHNLAKMASLSPYQFEQRMVRIFEITAGQFIQKVRMDAAIHRLSETKDPLFQIALNCGYSDQSTFSRQFKQTVGLPPALYRKMFREDSSPPI